jgi:signal transduction histidine kinase
VDVRDARIRLAGLGTSGLRGGVMGRAPSVGSALSAPYAAGILALAAGYYGAAKVGYELEFAGPVAAIVWLPAGVAIAFLFLGGLRFWPGLLIGDLLANDYHALPLGSALGQTLGNVLEVLVAVVLLHRLVPRGSPLDNVGGLVHMVAAIAAGTAVSATIGALSLRAGGVVAGNALPTVWRTWWLGDLTGALVLVPLALAWYRRLPRRWSRARAIEAATMLITVAALSEIAFRSAQPLAYLVFPAMVWAALRFGRRGATLAVAVAIGFAVWNTTHYQGPFVFDSITMSVLNAQLYVTVASLSTLCLAAVVAERGRFAQRLSASRARLVKASDAERQRLEHNLHDGAQQHLSALAIRLGLAAERAREAHEGAAPVLEEAGTELIAAIEELREIARGIHPAVLTDHGLRPAIRQVAARSPVTVRFAGLPRARFDAAAEATAYYVFVEALTNAQKYARASEVEVRVRQRPGDVTIEISDDGIGGAVETTGGGLSGLRDRVEALGGTFAVQSNNRHGTRIAARIPAAAVSG